MNGLQIWAHSFCRSTLGFYDALGQALGAPFRICLAKSGLGNRETTGFDADEFIHLDLVELDGTVETAIAALDEREAWHQLFGSYQTQSNLQAALAEAIRRGCRVGIASEAPCNMDGPGLRRVAKSVYLSSVAKWRFAHVFEGADFILNWSGDNAASLRDFGWHAEKIIPVGYFPPPLQGSQFVVRDDGFRTPFHVLCAGNMTWHRGPDVLAEALVLLKRWGVPVKATFTSEGPLRDGVQRLTKAEGLDCEFPGFVSMEELIALYEGCSVFVAPGRAEPWGMRVNDALHCGAPVVISRGMGGHKLVNDHGVGVSFAAGDAVDLAWQIRRLAEDPQAYGQVCRNLASTRDQLLPAVAAKRVASLLGGSFPDWCAAGAAVEAQSLSALGAS
jgi:glycosyltransferase involved in cell wall biosynthesis